MTIINYNAVIDRLGRNDSNYMEIIDYIKDINCELTIEDYEDLVDRSPYKRFTLGDAIIILYKASFDLAIHLFNNGMSTIADITMYMLMRGYTIDNLIELIDDSTCASLLITNRYSRVLSFNDVEYMNSLSDNLIKYNIDTLEDLLNSIRNSWFEIEPSYSNVYRNLPHFDEYNPTLQRKLKKKGMELSFSDGNENPGFEPDISSLFNMSNLFQNCKFISSTNPPKSCIVSDYSGNLSNNEEESDTDNES